MGKYFKIEIILLIVIGFLVIGGFVSVVFFAQKKSEELSGKHANEINNNLSLSVGMITEKLYKENDLHALNTYLEKVADLKTIAYIKVITENAVIIASSNLSDIGQTFTFVEGRPDLIVPIKYSLNLVIGGNRKYFSHSLSSLLVTITQFSLWFVVGIIVLSFILIRIGINAPLNKLVKAVEEVEKGNYNPDLQVKRPQELKRFAEIFSRMLNEIDDKNRELSAYSVSLEEKVNERTRELQEAQRTIIQQEKMASIGELAAGVAHEINNPTGFVIGNISVLNEYLEVFKEYFRHSEDLIQAIHAEDKILIMSEIQKLVSLKENENFQEILTDLDPLMEEISRGTVRIKDIVKGLRDFARPDSDVFVEADINNGIEESIKITWNRIKYKAKLVKHYGDLPLVKCNIQQLEQVFINMLTNAVDAIDNEGTIRVTTSRVGDHIMISFSDNGRGITEENQRNIFNPFFTTKEVGMGTGLGLSISHGIVKNHRGKIEVESSPGEGSTFTITLPIMLGASHE